MEPQTSLWTLLLISIRTLITAMKEEEEEEKETVSRSRRRRALRSRCFCERMQIYQRRSSHARSLLVSLAETAGYRHRWVYPQSTEWCHSFVLKIWDDEQWLENFRMTCATFLWLVESLHGRIERQGTNMRLPIPIEECIAITIWWLANNNCYREVGQQFGLAHSTIAGIIVEVCLAMELELLSTIICPGPTGRAMNGFAEFGFPHCIGAIDGCHIQIHAPVHQSGEYISRKGFFSMLLQGMVDHHGHFINVQEGHSGKNHHAYIFRSSNLFKGMDAGLFVPGNPTITLEGMVIPPLILGDAAYPIRKWLIAPYTRALTCEQAAFNKIHCQARNVVEHAFGRLKARWRCLSLKLPIQEENVVPIICACTILHNICEERGHGIIPQVEGTPIEAPHEAPPFPNEPPRVADERHKKVGQAV